MALVVQRDVEQPVVGVQRVEDAERVLDGVRLQRRVGRLGESEGAGAQFFVTADDLFSRQLAGRANLDRRLRVRVGRDTPSEYHSST